MSSKRREGAVLIARVGDEYYFVDSVFRHGNDMFGCTGTVVTPVTEEYAEYLLEPDQMAERYSEIWHDQAEGQVDVDCDHCACGPDEDGCEDCSYQSLYDFCAEIARFDGIEAVIDYAGQEYVDAMNDQGGFGGDAEYADCTGCGRIFGGSYSPGLDDFDEVYNRKALVAILAYEDGAVDYDYACRVIYGG